MLPTVNSYLITSNKDLYYWYCHTLGKKGRGKGLRGRSKALPCGIIVCSLPFRHEVLLDFEGGINVFSSNLLGGERTVAVMAEILRNTLPSAFVTLPRAGNLCASPILGYSLPRPNRASLEGRTRPTWEGTHR